MDSSVSVTEPEDTPQLTPPALLALSTASWRVRNVTAGRPCTSHSVGREEGDLGGAASPQMYLTSLTEGVTSHDARWGSSRLRERHVNQRRSDSPSSAHTTHFKAAWDFFMPPSSQIQAKGLGYCKWSGGYFFIIFAQPWVVKWSLRSKKRARLTVRDQVRSVSPLQWCPKVKECSLIEEQRTDITLAANC